MTEPEPLCLKSNERGPLRNEKFAQLPGAKSATCNSGYKALQTG